MTDTYDKLKLGERIITAAGASEEEKEIILELLLTHLQLDVAIERGYGIPTYRLVPRE